MGKKIVITGGAGFIGSHLCEKLLAAGNEVACVDSFVTGQEENIEPFMGNPRFSMLRHDVIEPFGLEANEIYNLACSASPVHYQAEPIQTTKTSVFGAINVLELARKTGARIFQASTSEVYGDPEVHPQMESYRGMVNPIGIRACYDEGKRCAESLFFDYHRQHGVPIKVARIFNTYGPRMHPKDGRVVSNFIIQALRGENLTVYGDGSQTRSFCYCDDLVDAFVKMMQSPNDFIGPVNLGNPGEFTILELAEKILAKVCGKSGITRLPLPQDDPMQRCPDITLAKHRLGWEPKVQLDEGLDKTIVYFESVLSKGKTT